MFSLSYHRKNSYVNFFQKKEDLCNAIKHRGDALHVGGVQFATRSMHSSSLCTFGALRESWLATNHCNPFWAVLKVITTTCVRSGGFRWSTKRRQKHTAGAGFLRPCAKSGPLVGLCKALRYDSVTGSLAWSNGRVCARDDGRGRE
jgi:hypothetical protein